MKGKDKCWDCVAEQGGGKHPWEPMQKRSRQSGFTLRADGELVHWHFWKIVVHFTRYHYRIFVRFPITITMNQPVNWGLTVFLSMLLINSFKRSVSGPNLTILGNSPSNLFMEAVFWSLFCLLSWTVSFIVKEMT